MIGERRRAANRANARAGGPRTAAGKDASAKNAHRHGLTLPVMGDPALAAQVERLARAIAGANATPQSLELARAIAEAEVDLMRVRRARQDLVARVLDDRDEGSVSCARLARLDLYERLGLSRRKFAVRAYDAARAGPRSKAPFRRRSGA